MISAYEVVDSGFPVEAHQFELLWYDRGTGMFLSLKGLARAIETTLSVPVLSLPISSSPAPTATLSVICFPQHIHCSSRQASFPGVLHRVLSITERRLATTTPPPSLPHAGILASLSGRSGVRVP
jgi:hypothetical protein